MCNRSLLTHYCCNAELFGRKVRHGSGVLVRQRGVVHNKKRTCVFHLYSDAVAVQ